MSADELAARGWRQLRASAERVGLLRDAGAEPEWPPPASLAPLPSPALRSPERYLRSAEELRRGVFRFFGRRFDLGVPPAWNSDPLTGTRAPMTFGKTLDYRDRRVVGDAKHLWELNRHLELVLLAQVYRSTGDAAYLDTLRLLLSSWIDQCPYPRGPNWCSSLELGIRLINWHLTYCIAGGAASPLFAGEDGARFRRQWLRSIYQHMSFVRHHLSTYPSSANNHLIGELAGLFVACCTWPCWPAAQKWRDEARALLQREIRRQTHADGVNKEQTTWYQQFVASLFLVVGVTATRAGVELGPEYWSSVERMLEFISAMMDVSGNVPMIGDGDDGVAFALEPRAGLNPHRAVLAIGAAMFDVPRWREQSRGSEAAADWLCADLPPLEVAARAARSTRRRGERSPAPSFPEGGYHILGASLGRPDEVRATVDAGPLGFLSIAAHGHADCLAMTLSVAGREQLIDPGTYIYHSDPRWRDYFRSTAAHNTVRVDGEDQARMGGPFLWLTRADGVVERLERARSHDLIRAHHDGYMQLDDPVRHTREIRFDKASRVFEVADRLSCAGSHRVERFWHFAESCRVAVHGGRVESDDGRVRVVIEVAEPEARLELFRGSETPIAGWVSRRFGHKAPSPTVVFTNRIDGEAVLRTRISVVLAESRAGNSGADARR